ISFFMGVLHLMVVRCTELIMRGVNFGITECPFSPCFALKSTILRSNENLHAMRSMKYVHRRLIYPPAT
ncbi:MAG: hypothetical protein KDJ62_00245, partial [Rhodobiaceae bacterium]|nr:hypothetical protein [Rhodobiaceae bacterium]